MSANASVTLPGTVAKVIPSPIPSEPEKAQISIEGADDLYREVRIENALKDGEDGNEVRLKKRCSRLRSPWKQINTRPT